MRPEENPLDLNNFPDENSRDIGKQVLQVQDSSSSGLMRKKKSGKKDGKDDESGKVYECRFCSLKFCKSQALGGHMNRHRQERETETLNHARQLVFRNDRTTHVAPHLAGCCQPIASAAGNYHPASSMGDPTIHLKFPRYISGSSSTHKSPPLPAQQFLYASSPNSRPLSHHSASHQSQLLHPAVNDYYLGHVLTGSHPHNFNNFMAAAAAAESNYTCIGAPVGVAFGKDIRPLHNNQPNLDPPSVINQH